MASYKYVKTNKRAYIIVIGTLVLAVVTAVAIAVPLTVISAKDEDTLLELANKLLDEEPVIDGHNDWPYSMRGYFQNQIYAVNLDSDFTKLYNNSHTDIPRLKQGKVGAQFWSCFCSCASEEKDAVRLGLEQIDVIKRFVAEYPDVFMFARTADDIDTAQSQGKIASLIGVEGGHMIDSSLAALRMYYDLGMRYMTLTHSCDTPWASSASSTSEKGLNDFGKLVVKEMNRLGMLVDIAHVDDVTMNDVFDATQAPVIYSHSSARALCDNKRNVPDDILQRLKENQGIIMINFYNYYITCSETANTSNVADHYDYIKNLIGVDYLGIGADYDGVNRMPTGLEDVSKYPNLIAELLRRGWSDDDVRKIAGMNLKRVLRGVEEKSRDLQKSEKPGEEWIGDDIAANACRSNATRF